MMKEREIAEALFFMSILLFIGALLFYPLFFILDFSIEFWSINPTFVVFLDMSYVSLILAYLFFIWSLADE